MSDTASLFKLLALIREELGAQDSRLEIGGRSETVPQVITHELSGGWRLVALYDEPPADADRESLRKRLAALAQSFSESVTAPTIPPFSTPAALELDELMERVREQAAAELVAILDRRSPTLWAIDPPRLPRLDGAERAEVLAKAIRTLDAAGLNWRGDLTTSADVPDSVLSAWQTAVSELGDLEADEREPTVVACHALAEARAKLTELSHSARGRAESPLAAHTVWVRSFANIYALVLITPQDASQIAVERAVTTHLNAVEQLVLRLPPVPTDPNPRPRKGAVIALRPRK